MSVLKGIHRGGLDCGGALLPLFRTVMGSVRTVRRSDTAGPNVVRIRLVHSGRRRVSFRGGSTLGPVASFVIASGKVNFASTGCRSFGFTRSACGVSGNNGNVKEVA